ncbi:MAG TPA: hypothetical protein VMU50_08890, partial [Polyangia bacterium]|nr:hypothetical protein [Polyangia bacterium]
MTSYQSRLAVLVFVAMGAFGCAASESSAGRDGGPDSPAGGSGGAAAPDASTGSGGAGSGTGGALAGTGGSPAGDAAIEAAPDAPLSNCRLQGLELCEDFESGALDPKVWGMHTTAGASITVDKEQAHGGSYALHVKLVAGQPNVAQITDMVTFPAKDNTFYTRVFVYVSPDLPADNAGG